jgi:Protein of unknown function (DUF4232)
LPADTITTRVGANWWRRGVTRHLLVAAMLLLGLASCRNAAAVHPSTGNAKAVLPPTRGPKGITTFQAPPVVASTGVGACTAPQLTLSVVRVTDTLGQWNFKLRVTNSSQIDCTVEGFPSIAVSDRQGETGAVASQMQGNSPPGPIEIRPGLGAVTDLHLDDDAPEGSRCDHQNANEVTLRIGSDMVGHLHLNGGSHWFCTSSAPGQLGVSAWVSAGGPDLDENDA